MTTDIAVWVEPGEPSRIAENLAERFEATYGRPCDGVWSAPGRVNLIGEHTDYNDGRCLPIALPHATYTAMAVRDDGGLHVESDRADTRFEAPADRLGPGHVSGWAAYVSGVIWAARSAGLDVPGVDVLLTTTVPVGAGLSSSAALACSVALGLCELAAIDTDDQLRRQLVECCSRAEREVAGAPTGTMDQTISLLAQPGSALLIDFASHLTDVVPWVPERDDLGLLVIDTRAAHELSDGGYAARRDACRQASRTLSIDSLRDATARDLARIDDPVVARRARHVVSEIGRVDQALTAIRTRDWSALGAVFDASHASLRDDFEVSCDELDVACATARTAGALGARMTGGGFGGSAIALVPTDRLATVSAAVRHAFSERGWRTPHLLDSPASAGARRVASSGASGFGR